MDRSHWNLLLEVAQRPEPPLTSLEDRVQYLEDVKAVTETVSRYGYYLDANRWDELFELFCDDVVRHLTGSVEQVLEGKVALRAAYDTPSMPLPTEEGADAKPLPQGANKSKHHYATDLVRIAPDRKEAWLITHYTVVLTAEDDGKFRTGSHHGSSVFTFRREDDQWRIARQTNITNVRTNPLLAEFYDT